MLLLSRKTVAERLDISTKTLKVCIDEQYFPAPTTMPGGIEKWDSATVEAWYLMWKMGFLKEPVKPKG